MSAGWCTSCWRVCAGANPDGTCSGWVTPNQSPELSAQESRMPVELEDAPQPGGYYRALVDGQRAVVRIVTCSDTSVVCNPSSGPQRVINRADILGPATDPFDEGEPPAVLVAVDATDGEIAPLTPGEQAEWEHAKTLIAEGKRTVGKGFYQIGAGLRIAQDGEKFRGEYHTFEAMAKATTGFSRSYASSLVRFANRLDEAMSARADIPFMPESPRQLRALEETAGDQWVEAFAKAIEVAGGEQPTLAEAREGGRLWEQEKYGRATGDTVWWIEDQTERVREGQIERFTNPDGDAAVRPTDGGGPDSVVLKLERLGKGERPGPPTPYGICDTCRAPLSGRDHCADCQRRSEDAADRNAEAQRAAALQGQAELETGLDELKVAAQNRAKLLGHNLGDWTDNGTSSLVLAARCTLCGAGMSLYGNETPPGVSVSPKLKAQCVPVTTRPADGRVDPETAPLETAADTAAIRVALKGLPPSEVLAIYGRIRRSDDPQADVRAVLVRSDLDRRRDAIDLPWCMAHGDYQPCRECDRAADRVEQLAESAGLPEIAGELKTAAGITPGAKPGFLKSAAEKVAEKVSKQPATPPKPSAWEGKTTAVISNITAEMVVRSGADVEAALNGYCALAVTLGEYGLELSVCLDLLRRFLDGCCEHEIDPNDVIDAIPGIARDTDAA
jgi:hypothetical protein